MLKEKNKIYIIIGVCSIILGLFLITRNYFMEKKQKVYDEISFALSEIPDELDDVTEDPNPVDDRDPIEELDSVEEPSLTTTPKVDYTKTETMDDETLSNKYYIGKIVIPKISLAKGFVSQTSDDNTIEKNIAIMTPSDYPDVEKGNFILAAHSGTMWKSFFKNLYKLEIDDEVYVYYKNVKYTYTIVDIYTQTRNKMLKIYRDLDKTTMTLITCTKDNKTKQTIYILERD